MTCAEAKHGTCSSRYQCLPASLQSTHVTRPSRAREHSFVCTEIARNGLGAIPASQSVYATTTRDSQNMTLNASTGNNYTVTFSLPLPARAFWSLTMYDASSMLLVNNTVNRYSIGDNVSAPVNMLSALSCVVIMLRCAVPWHAVLCCVVLCHPVTLFC